MPQLTLTTANDVQQQFALVVRNKRKQLKLSCDALAKKSTVPASTIKKIETTAQSTLTSVAKALEVKPTIIKRISKQLDEVYWGNKG